MKARLSKKGKEILKNSDVANALVLAIIGHPNEFADGMPVPVVVSNAGDNHSNHKKISFSVRRASSVNISK